MLAYRFKNNGSSSSSDEEGDEGEDREEEPTPSEDAPTRAALAMMADAEAVAKVGVAPKSKICSVPSNKNLPLHACLY